MTSKLRIPHPPHRPGESGEFTDLKLPAAGALPKPPVDIHANDSRELAFGMIRVLDDDGQACGEWTPTIEPARLIAGLRAMLITRIFDERLFKVQRQGRLSFYMKSTGEEAVSVAAAFAVRPSDMLFPTYRQQGLLAAREVSPVDMMCQCLSNTRDNLSGRQMPVLYSFSDVNFFTISGNLGTQFSQAVGWAMAAEYKGTDDIALGWIGEGSSAEADFHYALTFSAVYNAPVILNLVNNQWAISSSQNVAGGDLNPFAARGIGYGVPGLRVDGNDFLAVYAATAWAAERARANHGPTLLELYTYRAAPHSTSDDPGRYRPLDEAAHWPLGDPIERLKQHLIAIEVWSEEQHQALVTELEQQIAAAWKEATSYGTFNEGPWPPTETMFEDVYKEVPEHLKKQREELLG